MLYNKLREKLAIIMMFGCDHKYQWKSIMHLQIYLAYSRILQRSSRQVYHNHICYLNRTGKIVFSRRQDRDKIDKRIDKKHSR